VTAKKLSPKIPAYPTKIGERQQAMIVYMKSPNDFYIQPVAIYTKIEEMTSSVTTEFLAGIPPLSEVFEGDFCWAKYPDDSIWYRAYVS
jgi:Tudor domain